MGVSVWFLGDHLSPFEILKKASPAEREQFVLTCLVSDVNPLDLMSEHELEQLGFTSDPEIQRFERQAI